MSRELQQAMINALNQSAQKLSQNTGMKHSLTIDEIKRYFEANQHVLRSLIDAIEDWR